jgi:hypothetical protein
MNNKTEKLNRPKGMSVRQWLKLNLKEHNENPQKSTSIIGTSSAASKLACHNSAPIAIRFIR